MDEQGASTSAAGGAAASGSGGGGRGEPAKPVKLARPHRCNDRVEDLLQALYTLDYQTKIKPAWGLLKQCMQSEPGQEPQGGHVCVKDPSKFLDPLKMRRPSREQQQR